MFKRFGVCGTGALQWFEGGPIIAIDAHACVVCTRLEENLPVHIDGSVTVY